MIVKYRIMLFLFVAKFEELGFRRWVGGEGGVRVGLGWVGLGWGWGLGWRVGYGTTLLI